MRHQGVRGIRPDFSGLSPCAGQVAYVLLTSAPVAIKSIATLMLPLDLHVLSLSLAFILSQDQTLRCWYLVFFFFYLKDTQRSLARPGIFMPSWINRLPVSFLRNLFIDGRLRNVPYLSHNVCLVPSSDYCNHFNDRKPTEFCFKFGVKKIAHSIANLVRRKWCKVKAHFLNHQIFLNFFQKKFKSHSLVTRKRCVISV